MRKLLALLIGTITIFALVSCNDVDTSSTTLVVTTSSSVQNTSESIVSTSSVTDGEQFVEDSSSSSVEETSSIEPVISSSQTEETSSEQPIETSIQVTYHVRFVNYDDTLLYETDVLEGQEATYRGETPTRADEEDSTFEFIRWDTDFSSVTSDLTVKAVYREYAVDHEEGFGPLHWA